MRALIYARYSNDMVFFGKYFAYICVLFFNENEEIDNEFVLDYIANKNRYTYIT